MLQRDRLSHPAAPHDHACLPLVHEETDVVEDHVVIESLSDVDELDVVFAHELPWPVLLMSLNAESNQFLCLCTQSAIGASFLSTLSTSGSPRRVEIY